MRFLAAVVLLSVWASTGLSQTLMSQLSGKRRAEETHRDRHPTFPSGDTAAVYRAALDLLYIDGNEKASVALINEFVWLPMGGPCPRCRRPQWVHQSMIDTATIEAFGNLSLPPGFEFGRGYGMKLDTLFYVPNFRQFGYSIPLVFLSDDQLEEMSRAGAAYERANPPPQYRGGQPEFGELSRRYPGAWGAVAFTAVAFNPRHTEALLGFRQTCGTHCRSYEVVFFRKIRGRWTAVERVPGDLVAEWAAGSLRYRGPLVSGHSQLLVDNTGAPLSTRSDDRDVPLVYRAVLDSLYSFFGERPRLVVVAAQHVRAVPVTATQLPQVDSATLAVYNVFSRVEEQLRFQSSLAKGTRLLTTDAMRQLNAEQTGFWPAFLKNYPGAWGYVGVSRVAFNPAHTSALVYTSHHCGPSCMNAATWLLTRAGEKWSVVEWIPHQEESRLALDSLRYLGTGATPRLFGARSARGVVKNALTGKPVPNLEVTVAHDNRVASKIRTDAQGRYWLSDLPLNGAITLTVACPVPGRTEMLPAALVGLRPGLDTVVNAALDFRQCRHLDREHPLIAAGPRSQTDFHLVTSQAAAVYRAILDSIYPPDSRATTILMEPFSEDWCRGCFGIDAEAPRLIRKGVLDPSTEKSFAQALRDTESVPAFSYPRKIRLVSKEDEWIRGDRGGFNWDVMKTAYPGTNAVISFSGVGFNSSGTEALVEVREHSAKKDGGETMLLRKTDGKWGISARHVDRGQTSGEWSAGKCEPTDAPAQPADIEKVKKISGAFDITRVGTSRAIRGQTKKLRVVIETAKPNPKYDGARVGNVRVLDAVGKPDTDIEGKFSFDRGVGDLNFIDTAYRETTGHYEGEHYYILRTDGKSFFGGWWYGDEENTVDNPRGYFCARPRVGG